MMLALLILPAGCSYGQARIRDFGDLFRLEANAGLGLQVHANAGELVHAGVGSSTHGSFGFEYGGWISRWQEEHHFPLSYVFTLIDPDDAALHSLEFDTPGVLSRHRCYMLLPVGMTSGDLRKKPVHLFDLEVGALAIVVGVEVGFSIGEFFDFLLGFFTLDIADDDGPDADRTLWTRRATKEALTPK
jgi:hypothetical protein